MMKKEYDSNEVVSDKFLRHIISEIRVKSKFGENGKLLIIGGSRESFNPLIFAGWAASYSGIDALYVTTPAKISNIILFKLSWATIFEFPDMKLTRGSVNKILKLIKRRRIKVDTILIGPGLKGSAKEIKRLINELEGMGLNIAVTTGGIYKNISNLFDYTNLIVIAKEGELGLILNDGDTLESRDVSSLASTKAFQKYKSTFMISSNDKIEIYSNGQYYTIPNSKKVPFKFGAFYLLSGLVSGLFSLIKNPLSASIISSFILMKTCENAFENFGLHYTIENLSSILQDTVIKYLRNIEKI